MTEIYVHDSPRPALVDDEDADMCNSFRWQAMHKKSGVIYAGNALLFQGQTIRMHRLIMQADYGVQVDHIDGDGLNNQKSNLRFATNGQNMMNRKKFEGKTSQFKGVHWDKQFSMWRTAIRKDGKLRSVGRWKTEREAAAMYNVLSRELFGEYGLRNASITPEEEEAATEKHKKMRKIVAPTRFKGVCKAQKASAHPWRMQFTFEKKRYAKGGFDTPEEAAREYNRVAREVMGEQAILNDV